MREITAIVGCVEPNASDDHFGNTDCANMNVVLPFLQALKGEEDDLWNFGVSDQLEKMTTKFVEYNFSGDNKFSKFVASKYNNARSRYKKKEDLLTTTRPRTWMNCLNAIRHV